MPKKLDWIAIQKFYDEGHTEKDVCERFNCSYGAFPKAIVRGDFKARHGKAAYTKTREIPEDYYHKLGEIYDNDGSWRDLLNAGYTPHDVKVARQLGLYKGRSLSDAHQVRIKKIPITPMGAEARRACSERQSLNNSGGRCKWFWVGDQRVQGTWERDGGLKLTELGIEWRKCAGKADIIRYVLDDKERSYTPDFYLPAHDIYLEFKGFWWGDDRRKMDAVLNQSSKHIVILEKSEYLDLLKGDDQWISNNLKMN